MNMHFISPLTIPLLLIAISFLHTPSFSQQNKNKDFIYPNQFRLHVSNEGLFFSNEVFIKPSVYWQGGKNAFKPLIWDMSFIIGGYVNEKFKVSGSQEAWEWLQPGKIFDNGLPDNPKLNKYRIYKVKKEWESIPFGEERDRFEKDSNEWPVDDGAPWEDLDGDGIFTRGVDKPLIYGDETCWFISNDLDTNLSSDGFGLEVQTTIFGFNRTNILGDAVFLKFKFINKGNDSIKDTYWGIFSHSELGSYHDDNVGFDSILNIQYIYNAKPNDDIWSTPPAAGIQLLQGTQKLTGNYFDSAYFYEKWNHGYHDPLITSYFVNYSRYLGDSSKRVSLTGARGTKNFHTALQNNFKGLLWSGLPVYDPVDHRYTKYMFPGDPYSGQGWSIVNWPFNDSILKPPDIPGWIRPYTQSTFFSGPTDIAPFDTLELAFAIFGAQGNDWLHSVHELKKRAKIIRKAYELNFDLIPSPEVPVLSYLPEEDKVTLWWKDNPEDYIQDDPYLFDQGYTDTTYRFEGYQVFQYRDEKGTDPKVIAVFDRTDGVTVIEDGKIVNGVIVKVPLIFGNDGGLKRYLTVERDAYSGNTLKNGNPYYFGVRAYAYSKNSSPSFVESDLNVMTVIPGRDKIDYSSPYQRGSFEGVTQIEGISSADVRIKIIDPQAITGDQYELYFYNDSKDSLNYSLTNINTQEKLINNLKEFTADTLHKILTEGFMTVVVDRDRRLLDSLLAETGKKSGIDSVTEVKGPNGIPIIPANDVYQQLNSTGKWMIRTAGQPGFKIHNIDLYRQVGRNDFEIRFTETGSEYYASGEARREDILLNDPKGKGRVPFEVWDVVKNERMLIKITDRTVIDSNWSQNAVNNNWESFAAYYGNYNEPLPDSSGGILKEKFKIGYIVLSGEIPEKGTVVRIDPLKPLKDGDRYLMNPEKANFQNLTKGKDLIDKITVFPNPYYGAQEIERGGNSFIRFTGLPTEVSIRIYSLAGVFITKLIKNERSQYMDWDLRNESGYKVASGVYIAYLELPGIGTKIMKLAVILGKEYLDRF